MEKVNDWIKSWKVERSLIGDAQINDDVRLNIKMGNSSLFFGTMSNVPKMYNELPIYSSSYIVCSSEKSRIGIIELEVLANTKNYPCIWPTPDGVNYEDECIIGRIADGKLIVDCEKAADVASEFRGDKKGREVKCQK